MINHITILNISDFIGIGSFALSGFYVASKDRLDILGIFIASFLTALGGGVVRDIIASRVPFVFVDLYPTLIVLFVLIFAIFLKLYKKNSIEKSKYLILCDSIGLISFSISGALVGVDARFNFFGVSLLAVITAVGGGVMRDMLLNKIPMLLVSELYGTIALLVGSIIYILNYYDNINLFSIVVVFVFGLIFRLLAYNKKWHLPHLE